MSFHAASLQSPRLKDALNALYGTKKGLTGLEWSRKAGILSPGTVASEINRNAELLRAKWRIVCTYEGTTNDRKVYRYRVDGNAY